MRCCSAQITSCWEDPATTLQKIRPLISYAAESGARIIAFPEQFATGWDPGSNRHLQDESGPIVTTLKTCAKEYSIAILGSFRKTHQPLPVNTAVAIGADGSVIAQYAKIHPFTFAGEDRCYSAGDDIAIFEVGGMRMGIAICYDLRFPELFRIYADRGVHGVIVPSAWPKSRLRHWELFIRTRAAENQMYVIGVNTTGSNPVDVYAGASMTAGPDGSVIARADEGETLLYSDLDSVAVEDARRHFPVHKDQRTDLYRRLHI
jgi:omega-amidase